VVFNVTLTVTAAATNLTLSRRRRSCTSFANPHRHGAD
jgi:hypothetical protein